MTRSASAIADTALDDLYEVQEAFSGMHALFTLLMTTVPGDHAAHAIGQLGIAVVNDWSMKALQWAECMGDEIVELDALEVSE